MSNATIETAKVVEHAKAIIAHYNRLLADLDYSAELVSRDNDLAEAFLAALDVRQALLDLLVVVGAHPDAMFDGAPLNAAFVKAAKALQDFDGPPPELTGEVVSMEMYLDDTGRFGGSRHE